MSPKPNIPTQEHLPIAGIEEGALIMADGSLRAVLKVEPSNFELKSETEQNAIIYSYQSFLNSLEYPIQIVIQSKKLDLEQYLIRLGSAQKNMTNDLLRIQIEDYVGFVRKLISIANIMSKRFYIIVSYLPVTPAAGAAQFNSMFHKQVTGPLMDQEQFARYRAEVHNRAGIVAGGVGRLGIKCELLDTQQLIELFYGIYNPDVAAEERLVEDISVLNAGVVQAPQAMPPFPTEESAEGQNSEAVTPAEEQSTGVDLSQFSAQPETQPQSPDGQVATQEPTDNQPYPPTQPL